MIKIIPKVKINPDNVQKALRLWNKGSCDGSPISHLLVYQRKLREVGGNIRQATNEVLFEGLQIMAEKMKKHEDLLHKRYIDGRLVQHIANETNRSVSFIYNLQKQAIQILTEELEGLEQKVVLERVHQLDQRLPLSTYQNLVGMDNCLEPLRDVFHIDAPPWIICIIGMGGIGKTSLTDYMLRNFFPLSHFEQVCWVSAKSVYYHLGGQIRALRSIDQPAMTVDELIQELLLQLTNMKPGLLDHDDAFRMLQDILQEKPHLIVIDNLETVQDLESLLPILRKLSNPTRFILTSRESLYSEPDIYNFSVPELSFESTSQLIRQEAAFRNAFHLKEAPDEELQAIYETVGGNPLALYLIVGLTQIYSLNLILADLREARSKKVKNLYTYIYRRAWDNLDELAQEVFVQMPNIQPRGTNLELLQYITGLPMPELSRILGLLGHLNLIQVVGPLGKRVYFLHSLTRTFLLEEVINWKNENG